MPNSEIARQYEVHPNQVSKWKQQALEGLQAIFEDRRKQDKAKEDQQALLDELYQKIGRLQVQVDWLKKKSSQL